MTHLRYIFCLALIIAGFGFSAWNNSVLFESTLDTPCILTIMESEYKLNIINSSVHKYIVTPFSEETLKHTIEEI
jgi:hypothetical protein